MKYGKKNANINAVKPNVIKNAEKFVLIINVKINANIINAQNYVMKFVLHQRCKKILKRGHQCIGYFTLLNIKY